VVISHSTAKHTAAATVNVVHRITRVSGARDGATIASGMQAVGGCIRPTGVATMISADTAAAISTGTAHNAATSDIGADITIPTV
jgi:hypothetical protein